jgi:glutamate 5-kinase
MNITRDAALLIIGIISLVGGFLAWWFAKVLSERKEDITQTVTLKYLSDDISKMQDDIKSIKEKCERIAVIEEKIKHLK